MERFKRIKYVYLYRTVYGSLHESNANNNSYFFSNSWCRGGPLTTEGHDTFDTMANLALVFSSKIALFTLDSFNFCFRWNMNAIFRIAGNISC